MLFRFLNANKNNLLHLLFQLINLTAYSVVEADVKKKAAKIKPPPIIEEPIDRNIDSNS